jgi:hypothetical protein
MQLNAPSIGLAAVVATAAAFWAQVKQVFVYISSLLFVTMSLSHNGHASKVMGFYLTSNKFKPSPMGKRQYSLMKEYVRPLSANQVVAFLSFSGTVPMLLFHSWKPLWLSSSQGEIQITFLRWTFEREKFLLDAVNAFNQSQNLKANSSSEYRNRFRVKRMLGTIGDDRQQNNFARPTGPSGEAVETKEEAAGFNDGMPIGWDRSELGQPMRDSATADMSLSPEILEAVKEAKLWREYEKWFKDRRIPWKRGMLLYGSAGTGKTAFSRALAQELDMPIFIFDLASMTNMDFVRLWGEAISYAPCIVLFEDLDAVFDKRKNVASTGMTAGLSFDCLLNTLDGVENSDGILILITTNDLSKIDEAIGIPTNGDRISSRPGRIDKILHFQPLDQAGKEKMAIRILGEFPREQWGHLLSEKETHTDTGAQFQDRCTKAALSLFWESKQKALREGDRKKTLEVEEPYRVL